MIKVHHLTFGPFAENTYILEADSGNCIVIDPGMYHPQENTVLIDYLSKNNLKPTACWLTHAHLDHVFGVNFVFNTFKLTPLLNDKDAFIYDNARSTALQYGLQMDELVPCEYSFEDQTQLDFEGNVIDVFEAPGHSPGSVCFYMKQEGVLIGGDVLFQGSIGRTDLPGGSYDVLMTSIRSSLMTLPDDTTVYSGHGPATTIGQERVSNPFILEG